MQFNEYRELLKKKKKLLNRELNFIAKEEGRRAHGQCGVETKIEMLQNPQTPVS